MKKFKKLVSLILVGLMMLSMLPMTAFASNTNPDGPFTITITGKTAGHTYDVYQIFAGQLATDAKGEKVLSNVTWGSGVDTSGTVDWKNGDETVSRTLMQALAAAGLDITENMTAGDVAGKMSGADAEKAEKFANIVGKYTKGTPAVTLTENDKFVYTGTVTAPGYYCVKDRENSLNAEEKPDTDIATYTDYILRVVGDVEVESKDTVLKWDKKILVAEGKGPEATVVEADANKAGVGEEVTYQLRATVPSDISAYNNYFLVMKDTLSSGLDYNKDTLVVTIEGVSEALVEDTDYAVYYKKANNYVKMSEWVEGDRIDEVKIAFLNIDPKDKNNKYLGKTINAKYSATVNEHAKGGVEGEPNKYSLDYTRDPNYEYPKPTDNENTPGLPDSTTETVLGHTPDDVVVTYTARLQLKKTQNDDHTPLKGAKFRITGLSQSVSMKAGVHYVADANGSYYQLKDGSFTMTAPTEDPVMQVRTDGVKAGYVVAEDDYTENDVVNVGGVNYRPYKETDTGKDVYIKVEPTESQYVSTTQKFSEKKYENTGNVEEKFIDAIGESDADGIVRFYVGEGDARKEISIGEGTFTITEIVTPDGFNTIAPLTLVTKWALKEPDKGITTGNEECVWSVDETLSSPGANNTGSLFSFGKGNDNDPEGKYHAIVINKSGSLLPSTGGIGTTIFYIVGGILIVGAGVLLVAKKRMSAK